MTVNVLVLGDGIGGIVTANLLLKKARSKHLSVKLTLIGNSAVHTYQPGLLFLPFQKPGYRKLSDIQRQTAGFIAAGIEYVCERITAIDTERRRVSTETQTLSYDWLVLALGCRTLIGEVAGLSEHWGKSVHGFYTPDSAMRLARALADFEGGDLVVDVAEVPIKCPVAPLEFACLADEYLTKRGLRDKTRLTLVTPLSGAFTKPVCNEVLTSILVDKGINVVPNASLASVTENSMSCPDGHANCFIETGHGKAVLIDFNYDVQPVPGKFPMPVIGPMSLLKETYLNHLGKLAFKHIYWNMLLPARPLPMVGARMSALGKQLHFADHR